MTRPAVISFTASAKGTAARVADAVSGEQLHVDASPAEAIRSAFRVGRPVIGVCASGILIRILAREIAGKHDDPPAIAVAEDGSVVVPLLGGHHGANRLARQIAEAIGGIAVITTASDVRFGIALDDPPDGYTLANPQHVKPFVASLLDGGSVAMSGTAPWLEESGLPVSSEARLKISVTDKAIPGDAAHLVYHPRTLLLGVGCERGASAEELIAHVDATLEKHQLAKAAIAGVFSLDLKADEPAMHALAEHLDVPVRFFTSEQLNALSDRLANPSATVMREVGCPGVAEGAALAAGGPEATLIVEKTRSKRTTCAVAMADAPVTRLAGQSQGKLFVVGLGPGDPSCRTPAASHALEASSDWVGYGLYLDLAADLLQDQTEHRFDLGREEDRVRHALALASTGKTVALICSGDAGIYAMASLVHEVLDQPDTAPEVSRVAIHTITGVSAFQAAAAKSGALIGHDFCTISLSDLLTPWDVIETRVKAAAAADFNIAFYNPRSLRRTTQLERAVEILKTHRPPDTPVVIASNLERPNENIRVTTLVDFDPSVVDMLTLVLVGSSQSRSYRRGDGRTYAYAPRGYASKWEQAS